MSEGRFPAGRKLVKGGHDQDGAPLYHCMVMHNGIRIPGKTNNHLHGCEFAYLTQLD
ncbi:uncharacterized protein ARMOST_17698 [Armillaria ostoyae]|uniref:Uncharacterized protein n=1 Tax=Armillaria ostoyae TaxID=47428 RepID=A0A284RZQ1_ARMOS|nr:uncharacterized protein ARMOST_17698 [Armillaria ostoyae]